jgi:hypothetical protein
MSYPQMKCGIYLPGDLIGLPMSAGNADCSVYVHPSILSEHTMLETLWGLCWDQENLPEAALFCTSYTELVAVSASRDVETPVGLPGEAHYQAHGDHSAMAHTVRSLFWAYGREYKLLSFVYAAAPLASGGVQEFSRELPVPTASKIKPGHFWKLLLVIEPGP